jgi:hypothetical protein
MHHPDICHIMLVIDDYFILVDDSNPNYSIKSLVNDSQNGCRVLGVNISRQLLNGYIHADIFGEGKDDDTITFKYYSKTNADKPIKCIGINDKEFSDYYIRDAVRTILKLDKISMLEEVCCN